MINIPYQGRIVHKYGDAQYNIAMEECAELIQAINKHLRYNNQKSREHLIEEISDVLICIDQLKILADIKPFEIQHMIDYKTYRNVKRLLEGEDEENKKDFMGNADV